MNVVILREDVPANFSMRCQYGFHWQCLRATRGHLLCECPCHDGCDCDAHLKEGTP